MREDIELEGKKVVLVGTAHVSRESGREVKDVIEEEKPDVVCVELDDKRYEALVNEEGWKGLKVNEALREGKGHLLLLNVLLSIYQRRLGDFLDVKPGMDMISAVEEAGKAGIPVEMIDRDINHTMREAMNSLNLVEKARLFTYFLASFFSGEEIGEEDIERMKTRDVIQHLVDELGASFPDLKTSFLDNRNAHMAGRLREIDAERIVAVVGAAHVDGIKDVLESGEEEKLEEPSKRRIDLVKVFQYGFPTFIIGMFLYILFFIGIDAARNAFVFWFLANGIFGALGAIAARAHVATIVTSFFVTPFTSVNPALPSGLVAAYVENRFRPPTVGDLEDVGSLGNVGEFWTNSALRLLLVFTLVNLFSSVASFLGGGYLAKILSGV